MKRTFGLLLALAGCGGNFEEQSPEQLHTSIGFTCAHAEASCDACHAGEAAPTALDPACLGCHEAERPASHDPVRTADCSECHSECGWDATSVHPAGYEAPELHGVEFNLQSSTAGDCRDCHGADLTGDTASGCDTCHTESGAPDWRTDCTFCHGGTVDETGAPPHNLDGSLEGGVFPPHTAHVQPGGDYRALPCSECHVTPTTALDAGHTFDDTPGLAEVDFSGGIAPRTVWDGQTCSSDSCHGMGRPGVITTPDGPPVECGSCHGVDAANAPGSSVHDIHLEEDEGVTCEDCHADVVDATNAVIAPARHPNGVRDIAFVEPGFELVDNGCVGSCHGVLHDGDNFGHPEGYEEPEWHGVEAVVGISDCTSCHGADGLGGTSGQDCDECHEAGWRSDCSYCHGTGPDGLPPEDLDGTSDEDQISFRAHPEHASTDRHPSYGCESCHGQAVLTYSDAMTDPGHWFTPSPGRAEVEFSGIASGGTYATGTCTNYCHGSGQIDGTQTDGGNATQLGCGDCHASPPRQSQGGSAQHRDHRHDRVSCDWCHDSVAASSTAIAQDALHVDGSVQVVFSSDANQWGGMTWNTGTKRCSGTCHAAGEDERHDGERWR